MHVAYGVTELLRPLRGVDPRLFGHGADSGGVGGTCGGTARRRGSDAWHCADLASDWAGVEPERPHQSRWPHRLRAAAHRCVAGLLQAHARCATRAGRGVGC